MPIENKIVMKEVKVYSTLIVEPSINLPSSKIESYRCCEATRHISRENVWRVRACLTLRKFSKNNYCNHTYHCQQWRRGNWAAINLDCCLQHPETKQQQQQQKIRRKLSGLIDSRHSSKNRKDI